MKVNSQQELDRLYQETTFAKEVKPFAWDRLQATKSKEYPLGRFIHVPQGSCFGDTLISLADTYENGGEDCLFIQELVRFYREGRLKVHE